MITKIKILSMSIVYKSLFNCILFIFIICFCKRKGYPVNKKVNSFSNASLEKIGCFSVGTLTKLLDDTSVLVLT